VRFLADENIPWVVVDQLRKKGHDVIWVAEQQHGADDETVLSIASNDSRILLTFDRDFGEMIFHLQMLPPPGIVYLRFIPESPKEAAETLLFAIDEAGLSFEGHFTVLHRDHIRQRPLSR
jgi:predicted nuclease of predicted toxin-antitoxin system